MIRVSQDEGRQYFIPVPSPASEETCREPVAAADPELRYAVLLSPQAVARVHAALSGRGTVDVLLDPRELLAELAVPRDVCIVIDPALISATVADIVATRLREFPRVCVAFASVSGVALESSIILARRTDARFVFRGTPNERSALERALLVTPDSTLGLTLLSILEDHLRLLPSGVRDRIETMFRNGDGPASPQALAASTALARRTLDRYLSEAGFVSARRVIEAARVTAAYRVLTTTRTALGHVANALGYKSQRTLDAQLQLLLDCTSSRLRAEPLPCEEAARRLFVRLTERETPTTSRTRRSVGKGTKSRELVLISGTSGRTVARRTQDG